MTEAADKPLVWLHSEIKTPPFSQDARIEAGILLRRLQRGEALSLPHSRTMPSIGSRCHELRVTDGDNAWRIIYRADPDAIIIVEVFSMKSPKTPSPVIDRCKARLRRYDGLVG
ncbi:MAG TPA: type II toxin-antitoxin system RelE/ParE family toxin [Candidatus Acidoferrales bacterium]|nr:type II toxin-antitoxin system RelE/ParE family toxin [Candidatus Acidoferrales bacterium]